MALVLWGCDGKQSTGGDENGGADDVKIAGETHEWSKLHLIADFTSQYCLNCPTMIASLETFQTNNPDKTIIAAFHPNSTDYADAYGIALASSYMTKFDITGLPTAVFNLHSNAVATSALSSLQNVYETQEQDYPAVCGVAIESTYDASSLSLSVTAKITSNEEIKVRYLILLLESDVYGYQLGADNLVLYHDHIVRAALSNNVYGEKLNSGSALTIGTEYTATKTTTLDSSWDVDNMDIIVCALISEDSDKTYFVTNCNTCPLGESVDYLL